MTKFYTSVFYVYLHNLKYVELSYNSLSAPHFKSPKTHNYMKDHIHSQTASTPASQKLSRTIRGNQTPRGFADSCGGRIVRLRKEAPFYERLVTGQSATSENTLKSKAILESVSSNLEAGIKMVDKQETCLAKIGGRLSDMALSLNKARDPHLSNESKIDAQKDFESA